MGNSSSSSGRGHHDDTVDGGSLFPQGVYTGPQDWDQSIVSHLIVGRKLAPFYRPLEDYDDSWDDEQILAAKKELPDPDNPESVAHANKSRRIGALKEPAKPEAHIYRGAVECPICFLYYPPNINHSRCCDQTICTECFVQIKRNEPTTTHLVSEAAACPYCVQDNFGIVYTPPPWRTGLGSEGNSLWSDPQRRPTSSDSSPPVPPTHKRRQKSFGADSPEVTTTDQIRPDWEAKLESVRAAVARRANRRIIMRQVGDRLIPVGVTSGRVQVLSSEEAAAAAADGGSRRNRRRPNQQNGGIDQYVGMAGQDLEELMLMEAMRLSLLDHEEHQRKEAEEKKKQEAAATATAATAGMIQGSDGPGPSTLEGRQSHFGTSSSLSSASSMSRSASPSIPNHTQDSLTPNTRSWSISRCRTPPPPPSSAGPSAPNSSPVAFLAATTPSNGNERWASRSITPEPGNRNPVISQPSGARRLSLDNSMPIINDRPITPRVSEENNNTKPSVPFSNVNLLEQQTSFTSQATTSTSTSTTNELGYLSLSSPHLPSLDFEANDDSSKSHLINAGCQSQC